MTGSIYQWSQTASANDTADSTINWQEGQLPSTVNNSARAMMAAIASWRSDLGGGLTSGGTANALTLTPNVAATAIFDGLIASFRAANTNTGAATLNVSGQGALNLRVIDPAGARALAAGEITANGHYVVQYNATLVAWVLLNPSPAMLHLSDGTVAAPSVSFKNETGSGMFFDDANSRVSFSKLGTLCGYYTTSGWVFPGSVVLSGLLTGTGGMNISGGTTTINSANNVAINFRTIITGDGSATDCLRLNRTSNGGAPFTYMFVQNAGVTTGSISYNGTNTLYNATSDGRLKPVREAFDAGALVDALVPVRHNWTHAPDIWDYGLIAQDVQAIVPRAVMEGSGEPGDEEFHPWSVDYSKLVPILLAELKSLRARVAALESA